MTVLVFVCECVDVFECVLIVVLAAAAAAAAAAALILITRELDKFCPIIIILSCRPHGYPSPSHLTFPYRSSPPAGLLDYIPYRHIAAVCMFELVVLLLLGHKWGSIEYIPSEHVYVPPAVKPTWASFFRFKFNIVCKNF